MFDDERADVPAPRRDDEGASESAGHHAAVPHPRSDEGGLSDRDRAVLAFAKRWWRYVGNKEQAIREHLGMSPNRYYQLLNALLDRPEALEYDPALVNRLRRERAVRRRGHRGAAEASLDRGTGTS